MSENYCHWCNDPLYGRGAMYYNNKTGRHFYICSNKCLNEWKESDDGLQYYADNFCSNCGKDLTSSNRFTAFGATLQGCKLCSGDLYKTNPIIKCPSCSTFSPGGATLYILPEKRIIKCSKCIGMLERINATKLSNLENEYIHEYLVRDEETKSNLESVIPEYVIKAIKKFNLQWNDSDQSYNKASGVTETFENFFNEISPKKVEVKSEYLGTMNWIEAMEKAKELGMRLPTGAELKAMYTANMHESWNADLENLSQSYYWTSEEYSDGEFSEGYAACFFDMAKGNLMAGKKAGVIHVRCIR